MSTHEKSVYDAAMNTTTPTFGDQLRMWRRRRHLSQEALADRANLSTRHLSFLETGRSNPSREMVLRLADRLGVPLRERNPMLQAAGYAPRYRSTPLDAPEMQAAKRSLDVVLLRHMPNPCLAFDRSYNVLAANAAASALMQGADADLLVPPVNVVRLSLHPRGIAPRIANLAQWRHHILERIEQQFEATGDPYLGSLLAETREYPVPDAEGGADEPFDETGVLLPLKLRTDRGVLSFISTVTVFGTPHDITLQELAIETFFPADGLTAQVLAQLHG
jgi:transcriptional regulator with XRE-family HTH domain